MLLLVANRRLIVILRHDQSIGSLILSIGRSAFEHGGDIKSAYTHLSGDVQIELFLIQVRLFRQREVIILIKLGLVLHLFDCFVDHLLLGL